MIVPLLREKGVNPREGIGTFHPARLFDEGENREKGVNPREGIGTTHLASETSRLGGEKEVNPRKGIGGHPYTSSPSRRLVL